MEGEAAGLDDAGAGPVELALAVGLGLDVPGVADIDGAGVAVELGGAATVPAVGAAKAAVNAAKTSTRPWPLSKDVGLAELRGSASYAPPALKR